MEFGIIPPVRTGATADPDWMTAFARHVEASGFESLVMVEHAVVISDYTSTYPYAASGRMPLPDDCRIPDPLDLMAFLAAVTERITLATGVLVAPNHQPVVLAKRIATVDVLSRGRVRMCLGVGWMEEELRATGADPRTRGRRTDETIEAMRVLWADAGPDGASYSGDFVRFEHAHSFPKPARPGGVPLHIGGHSEAAARRAGRLGDGFQPLGLSPEDLALRIAQMRQSAEAAGRDPDAIELSVSGYLPTVTEEEVAAAGAAGIHRMLLSTSMSQDLEGLADEVSTFATRFGLTDGMTDVARLRALAYGYAAAVDALDGEAFASLFTEDGELWVPDPARGPDPTICRSGAGSLGRVPSGLARYHVTHHRVGRADYVIDGDTATGAVTGVAHHLAASAPGPTGVPDGGRGTDTVWFLRYEDRYRREAAGWRIARRALHLRWIEERPLDRVGPAR